jgi:hypothetical protein
VSVRPRSVTSPIWPPGRSGLRFDPARAGRAIRCISFLRLAEGELAGNPFVLYGWQAIIVGSVFG